MIWIGIMHNIQYFFLTHSIYFLYCLISSTAEHTSSRQQQQAQHSSSLRTAPGRMKNLLMEIRISEPIFRPFVCPRGHTLYRQIQIFSNSGFQLHIPKIIQRFLKMNSSKIYFYFQSIVWFFIFGMVAVVNAAENQNATPPETTEPTVVVDKMTYDDVKTMNVTFL